MNKLKVAGVAVGAVGLLAVAGSFVWRAVAVPALVRYPTDLDVAPEYEGTVTIHLDPDTYAPLDPPREYSLSVHRHLEALGEESSTDHVVVHETLTLAAPGLFDSSVQEHQYVMDRRDMVNVDDSRAWAFSPDNPVDRSGSYRLQFPLDADAPTYPVYKNETASTYTATRAPTGGSTGVMWNEAGSVPLSDLVRYTARADPAPITDAYRAALADIVDLPDSLTIDQIRPILAAAGIDLDATLAALLPVAEPADVETLLGLADEPVALAYSDGFSGADLLDPFTGSVVAISNVTETIYATPDPAVTDELHAILERYPDVPAAAAAADVIDSGALDLIPVFTNEFHQTPQSIIDVWDDVRDQADRRRLAETTVPRILLIGGIVVLVGGAALTVWASRREHDDRPGATAA